jgi:hypothetical protein
MNFKEFLETYDKETSILLLEGKRTVLEEDKLKLISLGKLLALNTSKMLFRSGNANGSDYFFSLGISSVDNSHLQVITPYSGHRQETNLAFHTVCIEDINIAQEPKVIYQSQRNRKMKNLIEQYVLGQRNHYSIKAAYIIRDTIKAIGTNEIRPATIGVFYDDLTAPKQGGTGHTMMICENNNIPIINQEVWFAWLHE